MSGMESPRLEGTLAIIKPDAYVRRIEIEEVIMKEEEKAHPLDSDFLFEKLSIVFQKNKKKLREITILTDGFFFVK